MRSRSDGLDARLCFRHSIGLLWTRPAFPRFGRRSAVSVLAETQLILWFTLHSASLVSLSHDAASAKLPLPPSFLPRSCLRRHLPPPSLLHHSYPSLLPAPNCNDEAGQRPRRVMCVGAVPAGRLSSAPAERATVLLSLRAWRRTAILPPSVARCRPAQTRLHPSPPRTRRPWQPGRPPLPGGRPRQDGARRGGRPPPSQRELDPHMSSKLHPTSPAHITRTGSCK